MQHKRDVPGGDASLILKSVSVETNQETSEILIFATIDGWISQFVCNGWPIAINCTWPQLPVLEQIQQEVSNLCPEVYLITVAPLCKNGLLSLIEWFVETLWGASIHAATASEKPRSLITEAPGVRHWDLGLVESCEGSDWMAGLADWEAQWDLTLHGH